MTIRQLFLFLLLALNLNAQAFEYKDSLLAIVNNNEPSNQKNKASALIELSKFYWTNLTDSAISMTNEVIKIGHKINDHSVIADGYFNLGMIEYVNGSFTYGHKSFLNASQQYKIQNDVLNSSKSLFQGALCLKEKNNPIEALELINEAYLGIKDSEYYQLKYSLTRELGILHGLIDENPLAEKYLLESLKIATDFSDTSAIIESNISIGCFYQDISENNKSLIRFNTALKFINPNNNQLISQLYNHIGESHLLNNNLQEASNFFNLGLLASKQSNSKVVQARSHLNLSKIYEIQQKYALALIEFKLYNQINDSINTVLKTQKISDLQAKYDNISMVKELHLKDLEVEKSEIEKLESQLEVQNQTFQNKLFIGGLCIVVLFGAILLFAFRKQRKLNIKLDQLSIVAREIENTVIIADKDGELEWMNESYYRKYGLTIEQFKQKFGSNILKGHAKEGIRSKINEAFNEKKTVQYFITNKDKNGSIRHLRTTLTPTLDADGEIEKIILIDTEITDLIQADEKITTQRDELQHIYTQVKESIDYAQRIQEAVLPHINKIKKFFDDSFLLYSPKDVVSGDFYFVEETEKHIFFAGADCTGHGVPGALMSVICHNLLENAVHSGKENTDEILEDLNNQIIKKLRQSKDSDEHIKDGLDIALCRLTKSEKNSATRNLQYSGAHSAIYIISQNELKELKPDRIHLGMPLKSDGCISRQEIVVPKGAEIILFSDGFPDQKGEITNKKFYYAPFRNLLLEISNLDSEEKTIVLNDKFNIWKGNLPQADDVFVWGLKI